MTATRDDKKEAVRQKILDVALSLFEELGYEAVSVNRIVKVAGIAKGTFFNHFPKKADLLAAWFQIRTQNVLDSSQSSDKLSLKESLFLIAQESLLLLEQQPALWRAKNRHVMDTPSIQLIERQADKELRLLVTDLVSKAELTIKIAPAEFADLFVTLVTGTIREWVTNGQQTNLLDKLKHKITLFLKTAT